MSGRESRRAARRARRPHAQWHGSAASPRGSSFEFDSRMAYGMPSSIHVPLCISAAMSPPPQLPMLHLGWECRVAPPSLRVESGSGIRVESGRCLRKLLNIGPVDVTAFEFILPAVLTHGAKHSFTSLDGWEPKIGYLYHKEGRRTRGSLH